MPKFVKLAVACLATLMAASALTSSIATAHDGVTYFPSKWKRDSSVEWTFVDTFPSGSGQRNRIKDADGPWNAQGQTMYFVKSSGDVPNYPANRNCDNLGYQQNAFHWDYNGIDGQFGFAMLTYVCRFTSDTSEMKAFNTRIDSDEVWHFDSSTPPPSYATDLQAHATHELGHAAGFAGPYSSGHFWKDGKPCTDKPKQTMCPEISYGKAYWRSLESHDIHTFDYRY